MTRFPSKARTPLPALACVALGLYACSLQDFEYLQEGEAGAPSGGKGGSAGSSSGSSGTGGSSGGSAGTNPSAGGSGDEAGQGGEAGITGASGEGGAPAGGTSAGATAGGAPSAGEGGEGGVPTGAGGDLGTGGTGGDSADGGFGGQPPLVGNLLKNPGFELGLTSWTIDPPSAALPANRYVYTQPPNPANGEDSYSALATWHETAEYQIFISQTITRLEPGTYTFTGMFSTTSSREAYLFARCGEGGQEVEVTQPIPLMGFNWFAVTIQSFEVTADRCEIGFFVHGLAAGNGGMPDWLNADNFSFEKDP